MKIKILFMTLVLALMVTSGECEQVIERTAKEKMRAGNLGNVVILKLVQANYMCAGYSTGTEKRGQ